MSIYVMSDIHGYFDVFRTMLKKIDFSDEDELIIAGDYIDRGPQSLEMLRWMEDCPDNILLLVGNHDVEFAECISVMDSYAQILKLDENDIADSQTLYSAMMRIPEVVNAYFDYYGTIRSLVIDKEICLSELKRHSETIRQLPYYYKRTVDGRKYVIVHAGYYEDKSVSQAERQQFYLYAREEAYFTEGGIPDSTIIAGHTPTIAKSTPMYTGGKIFEHYDRKQNCTFYDIDCGCGYRDLANSNGRLACMRLGDEEVFYV